MRVTLNDGRQMTGQMLAFDKVRTSGPIQSILWSTTDEIASSQHMNVVLADTEEFRRIKKQNKPAAPGAAGAAQAVVQEEKRTLGLTIVRGAHIVSLSVESPPPADPSTRLGKSTTGGISSTLQSGPGVARPAGRGAAPPVALAVCVTIPGGCPAGANKITGSCSWRRRWCSAAALWWCFPRRTPWVPWTWRS